jgi:hypothetical protein
MAMQHGGFRKKGCYMKLRLTVIVLSLLLISTLAAGAQAKDASAQNRWGFLFDSKNLLALDGFEDGYQAGAGVKYWITPSIAARALLRIDHNTPPEESLELIRTEIGLGLAGEWHPAKRAATSPYFGGLAGFQILSVENAPETLIDIYFGGIAGVEVKLLQSISCFAEYQLLGALDSEGFTLSLGTEGSDGSRVLIGLIFYF